MPNMMDDKDAFINSAQEPRSTKEESFIKSSCSQGILIPIDVTDTSDATILGVSLGKKSMFQYNRQNISNPAERNHLEKIMSKEIWKNSLSDVEENYTIQISSPKQSDLDVCGQIEDDGRSCDELVWKELTQKKNVNISLPKDIESVQNSPDSRAAISEQCKMKMISPNKAGTRLDVVTSEKFTCDEDLPGVNILNFHNKRKEGNIPFMGSNLVSQETEFSKQIEKQNYVYTSDLTGTNFCVDNQLTTARTKNEKYNVKRKICCQDEEKMVQTNYDQSEGEHCRGNDCANVEQNATRLTGDPCRLVPSAGEHKFSALHSLVYDVQQQADEWLHICNELVAQCTEQYPDLSDLFAMAVDTLASLGQLWDQLLVYRGAQNCDGPLEGPLDGPQHESLIGSTGVKQGCFEEFVMRVKCVLCKLGPCVDVDTYEVGSKPLVLQIYQEIQAKQTILLGLLLKIITDLQPIIMPWMSDLKEQLQKLLCFYQREKSLEEQHVHQWAKIKSRNERNEKEYYKALLAIAATQRQQQEQLGEAQEQTRAWKQKNSSQQEKLQAALQKVSEIRSAKERFDRQFVEREERYIKLSQKTYLVQKQIKALKIKLKATIEAASQQTRKQGDADQSQRSKETIQREASGKQNQKPWRYMAHNQRNFRSV